MPTYFCTIENDVDITLEVRIFRYRLALANRSDEDSGWEHELILEDWEPREMQYHEAEKIMKKYRDEIIEKWEKESVE